jgi:hypothetical protein
MVETAKDVGQTRYGRPASKALRRVEHLDTSNNGQADTKHGERRSRLEDDRSYARVHSRHLSIWKCLLPLPRYDHESKKDEEGDGGVERQVQRCGGYHCSLSGEVYLASTSLSEDVYAVTDYRTDRRNKSMGKGECELIRTHCAYAGKGRKYDNGFSMIPQHQASPELQHWQQVELMAV